MKLTHLSKKTLVLILCVGMILPYAVACKNNKKQDDNTSPAQSGISDMTNPDGTRRDYVLETDPYYTCEKSTVLLSGEEGKEVEIMEFNHWNPLFIGDSIAAGYSINYSIPEDVQKEMNNLDYSDSNAMSRQAEIQAQYSESGIAVFKYDGTLEGKLRAGKGETVEGFCNIGEEKIAMLTHTYNYETQENEFRIQVFALDGTCEKAIRIDIENAYNVKMMALENGNFLIVNTADAYIFSSEGKRIQKSSFYLMSQYIFHKEGKYYIFMSSEKTVEDESLSVLGYQEINPQTGKLSERVDLNNYYSLCIDGENAYVLGSNNLSCIDLFSEQQSVIYTGNDNDFTISVGGVGGLKVKSEQDIYYLAPTEDGEEGAGHGWTLCHILKAANNPCAGRKILRVATGGNHYNTSLIQAYNMRPDSKARVVEYSTWSNTSMKSAYSKAEAAMLDTVILDMKSGTGPDVLLDFADYAQLNSDDLLIDLNPYLDGQNGIDRSQYFDNILRAFETDGKLYQIPLSISLDVLAGNPDLLGNTTNWTCEQFLEKIQSLGGDVLPLLSPEVDDPMTLLIQLLSVDMNHYVDYSKGEAYFDGEDFRRLLVISKTIGDQLNPKLMESLMNEYDEMQSKNETAGYHSTEAIVMDAGLCCTVPMNISTLRSYGRYADLCYGRVIVIGWPTTTGKGFAAEAASSVGISRYSNYQEEAWDFVYYLLSHDVQSEDIGDYGNVNIRLRRDSQEEAIEKTIASNNAELEKHKQHGNYGSAYLIDEAMGQKYLSYIEQITTSVNRNPAVFRLVKEEAAAYFKGQKSAEDVSKTIQNRVTTLIQESQ